MKDQKDVFSLHIMELQEIIKNMDLHKSTHAIFEQKNDPIWLI